MNLSSKLNHILREYSVGNKLSAYKKFKKIYLQNNKDIKLRYNLAVMQQELGFLDEAETNYISLIKHKNEVKYNINLYNLYIRKGFYQDALKIIDSIKSIISSLVVFLPALILNEPSILFSFSFIADKTCDLSIVPDVQADPLDSAI